MLLSAVGHVSHAEQLDAAWGKCVDKAIDKQFTIHGLRYTFTDLVRRAWTHVMRRALTRHV